MRSIIITSFGLILWAVSLAIPKLIGQDNSQAKKMATFLFIFVWLLIAGYNMWKGILAGYTMGEELPIFLMIFLIPTIAALFVQKKFL